MALRGGRTPPPRNGDAEAGGVLDDRNNKSKVSRRVPLLLVAASVLLLSSSIDGTLGRSAPGRRHPGTASYSSSGGASRGTASSSEKARIEELKHLIPQPEPIPAYLSPCDPKTYYSGVITHLHEQHLAIPSQNSIRETDLRCIRREATAFWKLCEAYMNHLSRNTELYIKTHPQCDFDGRAEVEVTEQGTLMKSSGNQKNPAYKGKTVSSGSRGKNRALPLCRFSSFIKNMLTDSHGMDGSFNVHKALPPLDISFSNQLTLWPNCTYRIHLDVLDQAPRHWLGNNLFNRTFKLSDALCNKFAEREVKDHVRYAPWLWRDSFLEHVAKITLMHDIKFDIVGYFKRTKLDKHTGKEVHLPWRREMRDLNLFRFPPDWSLHPRTRRWHVVCALLRKIVTENVDMKVLRVAEIGVFAGDKRNLLGETTLHILTNCTDDRGYVMPFTDGFVDDGLLLPNPETGKLGNEKPVLPPDGGMPTSPRAGLTATPTGEEYEKYRPDSIIGRARRNGFRDVRRDGVPVQYHLIDPWDFPAAGFEIMVDWYREHEPWKLANGAAETSGYELYQHVLRRVREASAEKGRQRREAAGRESDDGHEAFPVFEVHSPEYGTSVPTDKIGVFGHRRPSAEATKSVQEIDFLFVDGDHTYQGCEDDMAAFYPKTKIIAAGHDFRYWDFHGIVLAVLNMRTKGTPSWKQYGHRAVGPIYLDSENIHWSYMKKD